MLFRSLNSMSGISCSNPKGAFYAFPKIEKNPFKSDKEVVLELLKQKTSKITVKLVSA